MGVISQCQRNFLADQCYSYSVLNSVLRRTVGRQQDIFVLRIVIEVVRVYLGDVIPLALRGLDDNVVRRIKHHVVRGMNFGIVTLLRG